MRLLFYTDSHIRETGSFFKFNTILPSKLTMEQQNTINGHKFVANCIKKYEPSAVFNLGDIYHLIEAQQSSSLHCAHLCLQPIKTQCDKLGVTHYILRGNHDTIFESPVVSSITSLCGYGEIILEPTTISIKDFLIRCVPYYTNTGFVYKQIYEQISDTNLVLTHTDFMGAKFENLFPIESNLSPDVPKPVISGHIHLPQKVGSVEYVGSLIAHRFSNSLVPQNGIIIYDTDTGKSQRVINNLSKHYVRLKDISKLNDYNPENVVLQVYSTLDKEEVEKIIGNNYEYMYIKASQDSNFESVKTSYSGLEVKDPKEILYNFLSENNPDALSIFENVFSLVK